ncbi:MAG TPA: hypothetical protein VGK14_14575 [Novimethylophilus sp.]|uniref:hypothetical protein n=1 Tax=Novimethylophilus sp. TaxID=2137426 RepID=UPI002F3E22A8
MQLVCEFLEVCRLHRQLTARDLLRSTMRMQDMQQVVMIERQLLAGRRSACPPGQARIETIGRGVDYMLMTGSACPPGQARIETQ